jgi:hypothetical protein
MRADGFNVTFVFNSKNLPVCKYILQKMGLPFKKPTTKPVKEVKVVKGVRK